MVRRKVPWVDLTLGSVAVLMALESIPHPFGRDQGLYFYIGREWFLRGKLPYRDSFDVKTPGIYVLNGLAALCFGDHMWGPRIFDAIGLLALGLVCARLATPRQERMQEGTIGISLLTASVAYFGIFDFWNTGQCELWCTLFATASLLVATHQEPRVRSALFAGALGGIAILFKPPSGLVCCLAVGAIVVRAVREKQGSRLALAGRGSMMIAAYGVGSMILPAIVFGHIVAKGGASAMYDVLVVNNRHYVIQGKWVHSYRDAIRRTRAALHDFDPLGALLWLPLGATVVREALAKRRVEAARRLLPFALLLCSIGAVWAQMKFTVYHWGTVVAPVTLAAAILHADLRAWARSHEWPERRGTLLGAGILAYSFYANAAIFDRWIRATWATVPYSVGAMPRQDYLEAFPSPLYSARLTEEVGLWLKQWALPGDRLSVRGFEPQIYATSGLRGHGRFFWTTFLQTPEWSYRLEDWVEEDRRVFETDPPRWVVAFEWVHTDLNSAEYFDRYGYKRITTINGFVILEYAPDGRFPSILVRPPDPPPAGSSP